MVWRQIPGASGRVGVETLRSEIGGSTMEERDTTNKADSMKEGRIYDHSLFLCLVWNLGI